MQVKCKKCGLVELLNPEYGKKESKRIVNYVKGTCPSCNKNISRFIKSAPEEKKTRKLTSEEKERRKQERKENPKPRKQRVKKETSAKKPRKTKSNVENLKLMADTLEKM